MAKLYHVLVNGALKEPLENIRELFVRIIQIAIAIIIVITFLITCLLVILWMIPWKLSHIVGVCVAAGLWGMAFCIFLVIFGFKLSLSYTVSICSTILQHLRRLFERFVMGPVWRFSQPAVIFFREIVFPISRLILRPAIWLVSRWCEMSRLMLWPLLMMQKFLYRWVTIKMSELAFWLKTNLDEYLRFYFPTLNLKEFCNQFVTVANEESEEETDDE